MQHLTFLTTCLAGLATAFALPKKDPPKIHGTTAPTVTQIDSAIAPAKNKVCARWFLERTPQDTFWPACRIWKQDPAHQADYVFVASHLDKGVCEVWTIMTDGNKIIPRCESRTRPGSQETVDVVDIEEDVKGVQ